MAYSDNFPAVRPVFQADFANGGRIDPRATFSRASTANVFDGAKHLSSENLIAYSNLSSGFSFARTTLASTNNSAPDGGSDAASILETADTGLHDVSESIGGCVSGTQYSFVFYLKANGRTKAVFKPQLTSVIAEVTFDLTAATSTVSSGSADSHSITAIGSTGWYKCAVTVTATGTGTGYTQFNLLDGSSSESYPGDVTKGMYVWGASVSSTGETVLNETSGQIHREYAPTLVSKANNAARFETATDGQSMGCLIESQSSNLIASSEDLTTTWITSRSSVQANAAIAPSGELTADALIDDGTAANNHNIRQEFTIGSTGDHTASLYAKPVGRDYLTVFFSNYGGKFSDEYAIINLTNGSVGTTSGTISASAESVGNGWYRIQATASANSTGTARLTLLTAASSSSYTHDGDSFSGVLIWGVQFEEGSFASSYHSGGTTRAADSLSCVLSEVGYTGGPVTLMTENTFIGDDSENNGGTAPKLYTLSNGSSTNNQINVQRQVGSDKLYALVKADNTTSVFDDAGSTATTSSTVCKLAISVGSNDYAGCFNGGTVSTDTSVVLPDSLTQINIGSDISSNGYLNGHVKRVALYNEALSDTNLQALTS